MNKKNTEDVFEYMHTCFPHIKSDYSIFSQASSVEAYFYSGIIILYLLIILPNTSPYQASRIQTLI